MRRCVFLVLALCSAAMVVFGDGGMLILQGRSGGLNISVFASPSPLRVGVTDLSVLLQDAETDDVLLDGSIELDLANGGGAEMVARATPGGATNRLLYAVSVAIPRAGEWALTVRCRERGQEAVLHGTMNVLPPEAPLLSYWGYFAAVPLAIFLFVLNQRLKARRRAARLPGRP